MNPSIFGLLSIGLLCTLPACTKQSRASSDAQPLTTAQVGLTRVALEHDGMTREFLLYVPETYDGTTALPVLLNFHGFGGTSDGQMATADMRDLAESERFILAYPQGSLLNGDPHWNTAPRGGDNKSTTDDFGFIEALLDGLENVYSINTSRVYATGYSNGGDFSYSLACFLSDRITGIASVSGAMGDAPASGCTVTHPTAVMVVNGTNDGDRPYEGIDEYLLSVEQTLSFWTSVNNIDDDRVVTTIDGNSQTIERFDYPPGDGGVEVQHYKVIDGYHIWFNFSDEGTRMNRLIWDFLSRYDQQGLR